MDKATVFNLSVVTLTCMKIQLRWVKIRIFEKYMYDQTFQG